MIKNDSELYGKLRIELFGIREDLHDKNIKKIPIKITNLSYNVPCYLADGSQKSRNYMSKTEDGFILNDYDNSEIEIILPAMNKYHLQFGQSNNGKDFTINHGEIVTISIEVLHDKYEGQCNMYII